MFDETELLESARNLRESHCDVPETGSAEVCPDAGSSGMQLPHLDGLELIRQLWEAHPCREAATKPPEGDQAVAPACRGYETRGGFSHRSVYSRGSGATHDGVGSVLVG